jgi:hypothetical protein
MRYLYVENMLQFYDFCSVFLKIFHTSCLSDRSYPITWVKDKQNDWEWLLNACKDVKKARKEKGVK